MMPETPAINADILDSGGPELDDIIAAAKDEAARSPGHACEFCGRTFKAEASLIAHACEIRRRIESRDDSVAALAYRIYALFMKRARKDVTWEGFARSDQYSQFVRFARYCQVSRIPNADAYLRWLTETRAVKPHRWCDDELAREFMIDWMMREDTDAALQRTVDFIIGEAKSGKYKPADYFRKTTDADLSYAVWNGSISPWILLNCDSGRDRVASIMNKGGVPAERLLEAIDPSFWAERFKRSSGKDAEFARYLGDFGL